MSAPDHWVPGRLLGGRYAVERLVSRGGMGAIYSARDEATGQRVAIKLVLSSRIGPSEAERFEREARLLSELAHPNIVSYIAHGQTEGGAGFLVMEWLVGEDLASRLRRGPLGVQEGVLLLRRLCDGLAAAHARGIVHRDLKPPNIFLVEGDLQRPKLIDFGIARRMQRSVIMSNPGLLVGTPEYMAPEQARGVVDLTCAADVFALGCVLYECLSGRPAFSGEHVAAVLCRILFEEPPPLDGVCSYVPPALRELLEQMLRKEPDARPADAAAVAAALATIRLPHEPDSAFAPTALISVSDPEVTSGLRGTRAAQPLTPDQELLSVVLCRSPSPTDEQLALTLSPEEAARWGSLESSLSQLGARVHHLLEGTVVVTLPRSDSARDQVTRAARAALLLRELWPDADVAVLTGRGTRQGALAVGDVVDAGMRQLPRRPAAATAPGVRLDPLSTRLLSPRFRTQQVGEQTYLLGEDVDADETRPLLGRPTPCLGRDVELSSLQAVLSSCIEACEPRVVLVTGGAGQGKSRLLHELLRRVSTSQQDLSLLSGRGEPGTLPYGVLRHALRRYLQLRDAMSPEEQRERIKARITAAPTPFEPHVLDFLSALLGIPVLPADGPARRAAEQDPRLMRNQLRQAFAEFLRGECQRAPLLLVVDDLQWCDVGSVDLIGYTLAALSAEPLCVFALGRPEISAIHPSLWQAHSPISMALGRLGRRACELLIRQTLGRARPEVVTDALINRLIRQAEGNALYLEELIRTAVEPLQEGSPQTVQAMLQVRMGGLPATERHALLLASVIGQRFSARDLAALDAGTAGTAAGRTWLQTLREAELIEPVASGDTAGADSEHVFRNDLIREAAYELIRPSERAPLHRQVALYLESARPSARQLIAEHWLQAGETGPAIVWLRRAAEQALAGHDLDGTLRIAEQAVAAGASGEELTHLRTLQATAAFWQSSYQQCQRWALSVLPSLRRGSASFFRLLADALIASSRLDDRDTVESLQHEVLRAGADPDVGNEQLICLARISFHWLVSVHLERADPLLARLAELAPAGDVRDPLVRAQLAHAVGMRAAIGGDVAGYAERLIEVVAAFEEAGDLLNAALETTTLAISLLQLGQHEEAESLCRRNLTRCERLCAHQATGYARLSLGLILVRRGHHLAEAQALLTTALAEYEAIGHRRRVGLAHGYLALLFSTKDERAEALRAAERSIVHLTGMPGFLAWALALHADLLQREGRAQDALCSARSALEQLLKAGGGPVFDSLPHVSLGEALCALEHTEEARQIALAALQRLRTRLAQIDRTSHPEWRQSFLALPEQQRLRSLARRLCPQELDGALSGCNPEPAGSL